jgi:hypothetical protein
MQHQSRSGVKPRNLKRRLAGEIDDVSRGTPRASHMKRWHDHQALSGDRVVVAESRELDRFWAMLGRYGATALWSLPVRVRPVGDTSALGRWLERLIAGTRPARIYTAEAVALTATKAEQLGLPAKALRVTGGRLIRVLKDWCEPSTATISYPRRRQRSPAFSLRLEAPKCHRHGSLTISPRKAGCKQV